MASHQQYNQLQFSLPPPGNVTMPSSMAVKYNQPRPIFFQKLDSGGYCTAPLSPPPPDPLRFSVVSEQSLTEAMRLAKFDLQRQRDDSLRQSRSTSPQPNRNVKKSSGSRLHKNQKVKTKNIHSKQHNETVKQKPEKKNFPQNASPAIRSTRSDGINLGMSYLPAAPHSPPVRDSNPLKRESNEENAAIQEISRVRDQIETHVQQIDGLTEAAKKDAAAMPQKQMKYHEDIESERKRQMRAEEQTARSARTVYQLNQQVKVIQEEISKISSAAPLSGSKKVALLNKLAALYRGVLRAMQTFAQHLPDFDVGRQGLPRSYAELGLVLRQLSLCCAQVQVSGQASLPESVANLLREVQEYQAALNSGPSKSPPPSPHISQVPHVSHNQPKSPASKRHDFFGEDITCMKPKARNPVQKQLLHGKPTRSVLIPGRQRRRTPSPSHRTKERVAASPDREAVLRAGIAALARAANDDLPTRSLSPSSPRNIVPPLNLPSSPRGRVHNEAPVSVRSDAATSSGRGRTSKRETLRSEGRTRKVAGPSKPKVVVISNPQRSKAETLPSAPLEPAGYSESTFSSRAKIVEPHEWPETFKPPSPRRERSPRTRTPSPPRSPRSRPPSKPTSWSPRRATDNYDMHDVSRQVWFDRLSSKQSKLLEARRKQEKQRVEKLRQELGQSEAWLTEAEKQLEKKIHPILKEAELEMDADLLADSMLGDLLEDTIHEMSVMEDEENVEDAAAALIHGPTVDNLLERLKEIEIEQRDVRRRWASIVYDDPGSGFPKAATYFDGETAGRPNTPPPIEVAPLRIDPPLATSVTVHHDTHRGSGGSDEVKPICFTKAAPQRSQAVSLSLTSPSTHMPPINPPPHADQPLKLFLSRDSLKCIQDRKAEYERYLKQTSHSSDARFDPWQIVEHVADEIMAECMDEIASEIEAINSDIVERVCGAEFNHIPSGDSKASCPYRMAGETAAD